VFALLFCGAPPPGFFHSLSVARSCSGVGVPTGGEGRGVHLPSNEESGPQKEDQGMGEVHLQGVQLASVLLRVRPPTTTLFPFLTPPPPIPLPIPQRSRQQQPGTHHHGQERQSGVRAPFPSYFSSFLCFPHATLWSPCSGTYELKVDDLKQDTVIAGEYELQVSDKKKKKAGEGDDPQGKVEVRVYYSLLMVLQESFSISFPFPFLRIHLIPHQLGIASSWSRPAHLQLLRPH
jgi:hypothetical protein